MTMNNESAGTELKNVREKLGLSLEEVSNQTKVSTKILLVI